MKNPARQKAFIELVICSRRLSDTWNKSLTEENKWSGAKNSYISLNVSWDLKIYWDVTFPIPPNRAKKLVKSKNPMLCHSLWPERPVLSRKWNVSNKLFSNEKNLNYCILIGALFLREKLGLHVQIRVNLPLLYMS